MEEILRKANDLASHLARLDSGETMSDLKQIVEQLLLVIAKHSAASCAPKSIEDTKHDAAKALSGVPILKIEPLELKGTFLRCEAGKASPDHPTSSDPRNDCHDITVSPSTSTSCPENSLCQSEKGECSESITEGEHRQSKRLVKTETFSGVCQICLVLEKLDSSGIEKTVVGDIDEENAAKTKIYGSVNELVHHIREKHMLVNELERSSVEQESNETPCRKKEYLQCPYCGKKYSLHGTTKSCYDHLVFHLHRKHSDQCNQNLAKGVDAASCSSCSFQTLRKRDLARHMAVIHGEGEVKRCAEPCAVCGKAVLKTSLAFHMAAVHGSEDVPQQIKDRLEFLTCDICNKRFRGPVSLDRHKKCIHSRIKDYLCHLCSQNFFAKRDLHLHMFSNHKVNIANMKVFRCPVEGCGYETLAKRHLTIHAIVHKNTLDFTCEHCGKNFKSYAALRQHIKIMHTTDELHKCPMCSFTSYTKQYVRRHMVIHSGTKAHKCDQPGCSYETHFSENLTKHKKKHKKKAKPT